MSERWLSTLASVMLGASLTFGSALPLAAQDEVPAAGVPAGLTPPRLVSSPTPVYPPAALEADVQADVVLQIDITETGEVRNIVPLEAVLYTWDEDGQVVETPVAPGEEPWGFVPSAVAAMGAYRFEPATLRDEANGQVAPIPVQVTWRVGFTIDIEQYLRDLEGSGAADDPWAGEGSGDPVEAVVVSGADGGAVSDPDAPVNFRGLVLERGTRKPLANFGVIVQQVTPDTGVVAEVFTDTRGRFAFRGLPPGDWKVVIDEEDYFRYEVTEAVEALKSTDGTYYVERDNYGEAVSRSTARAPRREVTRRVIQVQEIQRIPGNNNDAIKVVQNLPGVARAPFGGGAIIVRGSEPGDSEYSIDGVPLPTLYHFGGLRSVIPSETLESIDFYPGAFSARYGRATGGILDVRTRKPRNDMLHGYVDVNVFDTGVFLEGPITDRLSFQVGGRRSYIDAILLPIADAAGLNFTVAPRYYDGQFKLHLEIDEVHSASVMFYMSDDLLDLLNPENDRVDPEIRGSIRTYSRFYSVLARFDSQFSESLRNEATLQVGHQAFGFSVGELFLRLDTTRLAYRDELQWKINRHVTLRPGIDVTSIPGSISARLPRPPREGEESVGFDAAERIETRQDFSVYAPAAYTEVDLRPVDSVLVTPGLRANFFRPQRKWGIDPRLSSRWEVSDTWTVKGGVGLFSQDGAPDEVARPFGNPDLELEQAIHYVAGFEHDFTDYLNVNIEFFYKDLFDLISRTGAVEEVDGRTRPLIYDNRGLGRVYGAELLLRHELANNFFGWIAYTLSRAERRDGGDDTYRLFDFDQTHILTALGSYNLPRNWSVGLRFRLVTGTPTTPIIGSLYDADADTYIRVAGEPNTARLPTFHQLDLRVDKRWIFDRWTLNAYLDLQNAYNAENQEAINYNYDFTQSAPVTGLPIIPSVGIRGEW